MTTKLRYTWFQLQTQRQAFVFLQGFISNPGLITGTGQLIPFFFFSLPVEPAGQVSASAPVWQLGLERLMAGSSLQPCDRTRGPWAGRSGLASPRPACWCVTDGAKRDDVYPHALKEYDVLQQCITDELLKLKIEKNTSSIFQIYL